LRSAAIAPMKGPRDGRHYRGLSWVSAANLWPDDPRGRGPVASDGVSERCNRNQQLDGDGTSHSARRDANTLKAAMLASGTLGKWFIVQASTGTLVKGFWRLGINLLKSAKFGI
jgi:hypothetical protein